MFSAAAVAKIHSHHVEAGAKCFVGSRNHVNGICGAFHAVPDHDRRVFVTTLLPTAMGQYFYTGFSLEQSLFVLRWTLETITSRPRVRSQCLSIATFEGGVRRERLRRERSRNACEEILNGLESVCHDLTRVLSSAFAAD